MVINVQSYLVYSVISYSSFGDGYEGRKSAQVFFLSVSLIILQKHFPQIARLFETGQCVKNIKLRRGDREHVRPVRSRYQSLNIFP